MKHYESPDENNAALPVLIGNNGIMYTCVCIYMWIYMDTNLFKWYVSMIIVNNSKYVYLINLYMIM